jgi:hypothetical protein
MPYFERTPTITSVMKGHNRRINQLERVAQQSLTQTTYLSPTSPATRVLTGINTTAQTLLSTTIASSASGLLEIYARVSADCSGSGKTMSMSIAIDGVDMGSYLSWSNTSSLEEHKTMPGSTVGTTTNAGSFIIVDSNVSGYVLPGGYHTVDFTMTGNLSSTSGSVYKAVIAIRST